MCVFSKLTKKFKFFKKKGKAQKMKIYSKTKANYIPHKHGENIIKRFIMFPYKMRHVITYFFNDNYEKRQIIREKSAKKHKRAEEALNTIYALKKDWNGNEAEEFSEELVQKCRMILKQLSEEPFVCPTACGAIQFEYEKENGEYLEFEIYKDKIEAYGISKEGKEWEENINGANYTKRIRKLVKEFYA